MKTSRKTAKIGKLMTQTTPAARIRRSATDVAMKAAEANRNPRMNSPLMISNRIGKRTMPSIDDSIRKRHDVYADYKKKKGEIQLGMQLTCCSFSRQKIAHDVRQRADIERLHDVDLGARVLGGVRILFRGGGR